MQSLVVLGVAAWMLTERLEASPRSARRGAAGATAFWGSVFVLVGVAAIRLRRTIGARLSILLAGVIFSIVVLVVFAVDTYSSDQKAFWTMVLLPVLALGLDASWKNRHRGTTPTAGGEEQPHRS